LGKKKGSNVNIEDVDTPTNEWDETAIKKDDA
jgi:hypothetical protein